MMHKILELRCKLLPLRFPVLAFPLVVISYANILHAAPPPGPPSTQQQSTAVSSAQISATSTPPTTKRLLSQEIQLTGDQLWVDTGIDVHPGERLLFSASGTLRYADAKADNTPDGLTRGFKDLLRILPFNDAGRGALIGRVGDKDFAEPFLIGARRDLVAPAAGRLSIGFRGLGRCGPLCTELGCHHRVQRQRGSRFR